MGDPAKKRRIFSEIRRENALLEAYYKKIFPSEDYEATFVALRASLPASLRLCTSAPLWRATRHEIQRLSAEIGRSETTSSLEAAPLLTYRAAGTYEGHNANATGGSLAWYPDNLAWQWGTLNRFGIKKDERFAELKRFLVLEDARGAIVRQEAASMIPPLFLDVHPHHFVLDMCAAPGSKTSQIMEALSRSHQAVGGIVANEINPRRAAMLSHQLSRLSLSCAAVTVFDASAFPAIPNPRTKTFYQFDRVLADVPCTGDGTLRKQPDIWKTWKPSGAMALHSKQIAILFRGIQLLKPGGRLVYSTCSMNPLENEAVVASVLEKCAGAAELLAVPLPEGLSVRPGLTNWEVPDPYCEKELTTFYREFSDVPKDRYSIIRPTMFPVRNTQWRLERCIRILPQDNNTGAFFVAVLYKHEELKLSEELAPVGEVPEPTTEGGASASLEPEKKKASDRYGHSADKFHAADPEIHGLLQTETFFGLSLSDVTASSTESAKPHRCSPELCDVRSYGFQKPLQLVAADGKESAITLDDNAEVNKEWQQLLWASAKYEESPLKNLFYREHTDRRLFVVTSKLAEFVRDCPAGMTFISLGARLLERLDTKQAERYEGCGWRLVQSGIPVVLPFMRKRVVYINLTLARLLLTGESKLHGENLLRGEREGQVFNLSSCRSPTSLAFSQIVPGPLVVLIVPPSIIPLNGHFPSTQQCCSPHASPDTTLMTSDSSNKIVGTLATSPVFLNGSLRESVPIACLVTKAGTLLPYISKLELGGLLYHLFGADWKSDCTSSSDEH